MQFVVREKNPSILVYLKCTQIQRRTHKVFHSRPTKTPLDIAKGSTKTPTKVPTETPTETPTKTPPVRRPFKTVRLRWRDGLVGVLVGILVEPFARGGPLRTKLPGHLEGHLTGHLTDSHTGRELVGTSLSQRHHIKVARLESEFCHEIFFSELRIFLRKMLRKFPRSF